MPEDLIYVPFPRGLYDDIVRFSDGRLRPESLAVSQVEAWVASSVEFDFGDDWGSRIKDVAAKYAPHVHAKWQAENAAASEQAREEALPLVWKEVTIAAGSDVRMAYGGKHHYAKVKGGKIVDDDGAYSPSEWASKIAGGTSRNAWRDLWFKQPLKQWTPAQRLRGRTNGEAE